MTPEHSFLYFFHQVMGLGYQMGTQKIGLGPLNKIKTYLEHFRTDKYFFPPKSNFFSVFLEDPIFFSFMTLCMTIILFTIYVFYGIPATHKNSKKKICPDLEVLAASFMSKCQNFLLFLRKKFPSS